MQGDLKLSHEEIYPSLNGNDKLPGNNDISENLESKDIILYDVVYASIIHQGENNANN